MTEDAPRRLVVGRLRKPHGLKGECVVFPLTDAPDTVFGPGREVWLTDLSGVVVAGPVVVERSRAYHRQWLIAFRGYPDRSAVDGWHDLLVAASIDTLTPPTDGEVYLHELEGFAVIDREGTALGIVSAVDEVPTGLMLEVQGKRREFLLPFRKEFVVEVSRASRQLVVELPDGMIE